MRSEGCLSVCVSTLILALQATRRPISDIAASELREPEKQKGDFPETTAFKRYAVKTSEKANMVTATWSARSVYLGLKKSQRMVYIGSHMLSTTVASPCQTIRELQGTTGKCIL